MEKQQAKARLERLKKQLWETDYAYYVLDKPIMSDAARDSLKDELERLEQQFPDLVTPDSPSQRIGGKALGRFTKIKHRVPKYSLDDVFSYEEVEEFDQRVKRWLNLKADEKVEYTAELKIDGLNMTFIYKQGVLDKAITRGDGVVGEDVTHNIRTIKTVPLRLRQAIDIEVGGEIFMPLKSFLKLNQEAAKNKLPTFANPRNAAAGTVRQLDPKIASSRDLQAFFYSIYDGPKMETQAETLEFLQQLGFRVESHYRVIKKIQEAEVFFEDIKKIRHKLSFEIDGVAIKVNKIVWQENLGRTAKHVRWACAYKYAAIQATTRVIDIKVQVGRTGALTPVALLEPVSVSGSTVSRATLHNEDEINRLDVRIGDTVIIQKAGDVIPDIVAVLPKLRDQSVRKFSFPKHCPECGSEVVKHPGEVAYYCTNKKCFAQNIEGLIHFVSKAAFNIDGLGDKIIVLLVEQGLVSTAADIFKLQYGDLQNLPGFAEKKSKNLLQSINNAKEIALSKFIYALGIRHVGEETALRLADNFRELNKVQEANIEELEEVSDIGPEVAKSIQLWFSDRSNKKLVQDLLAAGIKIINPAKQSNKFKGQSFLFTGTLSVERNAAKELVRQNGGKILGSVSDQLDYLVVGSNPGSKLDRAKKLNVKTLSEQEFFKLLK